MLRECAQQFAVNALGALEVTGALRGERFLETQLDVHALCGLPAVPAALQRGFETQGGVWRGLDRVVEPWYASLPMLSLRTAGPADAELIHAFVVALAEYEREPGAVEVTPDILRQQLGADSPPFECLIADWSGAPAGFALFFHTYSTWRGKRGLWLEDLFVLPEFRARGIGRALLAGLADVATARGCGRVEWAVLDWNQLAIDFYEKLGARPLDEWTTYRLTGSALESLACSR